MLLWIVCHTLALRVLYVSILFLVLLHKCTLCLLARCLILTVGVTKSKTKIKLSFHYTSCISMTLNFSPRMVVFSNNGQIGHCPRWKFILAQCLNFFRRYHGLRSIGSYPVKF